jgi:hypothetical protein
LRQRLPVVGGELKAVVMPLTHDNKKAALSGFSFVLTYVILEG